MPKDATTRANKVGSATPTTPMCSPKMHTALPAMLSTFMNSAANIEMRVSPFARNTDDTA